MDMATTIERAWWRTGAIFLILSGLALSSCGKAVLDSPEEPPPPPKELTYENLRDLWQLKRRYPVYIGFGSTANNVYFIHALDPPMTDIRGEYRIQGNYIGVNGTYIQRKSSNINEIMWQEPRKHFYHAVLTDSTLVLTEIDIEFLSGKMSIPFAQYSKDFSPDIIDASLSALQTLDIAASSEGLNEPRTYLSYKYYGTRISTVQ